MTTARDDLGEVRLSSGERVLLGPVLARAGEGTVYSVRQRPELAAKVFHPNLRGLPDKLSKVAAMVASPPRGHVQPNGVVVLTWPGDLLLDGDRPIGFVMPRIDTTTSVEIHTMSNPTNRADPAPTAPQWTRRVSWEHLVNTAANLCLAVQVVHRVDAVIGDFQERNILVSDTTEVTLVDCDSMQFTDGTGRRYLCAVGRPEFTAPELTGVDLRVDPREQPSDLFALAIHIHQLLMAGNHPFLRGTWTGGGRQPDALTLARSGSWAGGPGSPLHTHPLAPSSSFLPDDIQRLFERAFTDGAADPWARPSAQEWRDHLLRIQLVDCTRGTHRIPAATRTCPWCAIDDERASRNRQAPPRPAALSTSVTGPPRTPARRPREQGLNTRLVLVGLATVVAVVLILATFIVWALLSGVSTFGSG